MLEDAIFTSSNWLNHSYNQVTLQRFITASLNGWAWCRDSPDACSEYIGSSDPSAAEERFIINEINSLVCTNYSHLLI
jgi:NitT/TauT family transport system substrate-binding protein